jgi:probable rRNA maturation factor
MPVDIDLRHPHLRIDQRRLASHLRQALRTLGRSRAEVSVSLVDDTEIRQLNRDFRGVDAVTDVLSFALQEGDGPALPVDLLGDIVVSLDTAARQAAEVAGVLQVSDYGLQQETAFLCTHGLLHLLGHDHEDPADAEQMEALERALIASITPVAVHAVDRSLHGLHEGRQP